MLESLKRTGRRGLPRRNGIPAVRLPEAPGSGPTQVRAS